VTVTNTHPLMMSYAGKGSSCQIWSGSRLFDLHRTSDFPGDCGLPYDPALCVGGLPFRESFG